MNEYTIEMIKNIMKQLATVSENFSPPNKEIVKNINLELKELCEILSG